MLGHKAGLVVAVKRLGRQRRRGAGAAGARGHEVQDLGGLDAALLGQGKRVGVAHHTRRQAHLVAELGRLAGARSIKEEHLGREGLEDGQHRLHVLLGRAQDKREGAVDRALLATGHGTVEGVLVLDLGGLVDVAGQLRRAGGEVDQPGALLGGADQAVGGEVNVLDVVGVAHHGKDDVGVRGGLSRAFCPRSAAIDQALGLLLGAVVDAHRVAGVHDVAGNGGAHDAGANEGDLLLSRAHLLPF